MIFVLAADSAPAMVEKAQESDIQAFLDRAREARDQKKWPEALTLYNKVLALNPGMGEVLLERARLQSWMKRYSDSIRDYKRYIQLFPEKRTDCEKEMARVMAWGKQYREGIDMLEPYAQQGDRQAILDQVQFKSWAGQFNNCIKQADGYLKANPGDEEFLVIRGRAKSWSGQYASAKADFKDVLAKKPQHKDALLGLAHIELWAGSPETATDYVNQLSPEDSQSGEAGILRTRIDQQRGDLREARRDLEPLGKINAVADEVQRRHFELSGAQGPYLEVSRTRMDSNEDLRQDIDNAEIGIPFFNGTIRGGCNWFLLREPNALDEKPRQTYAGLNYPLCSHCNFGGTVYWLKGHKTDFDMTLNGRLAKGLSMGLGYSQLTNLATPRALNLDTVTKNWVLNGSYAFGENLNILSASLESGKTNKDSTRKAYSAAYARRIVFQRGELKVGAIGRGLRYTPHLDLGFFNPRKLDFIGFNGGFALRRWGQYDFTVEGQAGSQKVDDDGSRFAWSYNANLSVTPFGPGVVLFASFGQSAVALNTFNVTDPAHYKDHTFKFGMRLISPKWLW